MKTSVSHVGLLAAASMAVGCNFRPPQTETFVLHAPSREAVDQLVHDTAFQLRLKISQQTFDGPTGAARDYEIYGGGLSILVLQAMREGCPGPDGNYPPPEVDPERYDVSVAQTGLWAGKTPQVILTAFANRASKAQLEFEPKTAVQQRIAEGCRKGR